MRSLEEALLRSPAEVRFRPRAEPIPGDLRIGWRVSALILVLNRSRGKAANLEQIHFLTSALRSSAVGETALRWFQGEKDPNDLVVRYDPAMSRTISIVVASGLATWNGRSVTLTDKGVALAQEILADPSVLQYEKQFMNSLPRSITQKLVREVLEI